MHPREIQVPHTSYEDLRKVAERFLSEYNPGDTIPVPVEEIIEFSFGLDIIPVPGLHQHFEIDAFITSDMTAIYVDEFVYASRPGRYRFSLAHELAHVVLHPAIFKGLHFSTIEQWKTVVMEIPEEEYGWLEWQAYAFAGLILVPAEELLERFRRAERKLAKAGLSLSSASGAARLAIAGNLAKQFEVSSAVVEKRCRYDKLWGEEGEGDAR